MNETSFRLKDFEASHIAMPYDGSSTSDFKPHGHIGFPTYPDGLLRTSVPQLARFLTMFMNGGELDGARILKTTTVDEMKRKQIPNLDNTQGLIFFETTIGSRTVFGHDGDDPGTSSQMFFDPATQTGVLLVANGAWDEDAAEALMTKLFSEAAK
jgi:CubicO group peptidase (beta-lactamase class C family)